MSQITANDLPADHEGESLRISSPALSRDNITLDGSKKNIVSGAFLFVGLAGIAALIAGAFVNEGGLYKQALASYHAGFSGVMGITLGALFWVMIFHLTNAGWAGTVRRQFENVFSLIPLCAVLFLALLLIEVLNAGILFKWMNPSVTAGDVLYEVKEPFLNVPFFIARGVGYFVIWYLLVFRLSSWSMQQDKTGDVELARKSRFMSGWGLLLFALTTAFAGFDWLMTLDFHFFSTMWGVYFFAGGAFGSLALITLVLSVLRMNGKLKGVVTEEHLHDMGKLLFGFSCFWAYIAFSQYFLIWYSAIPEETAYMIYRKDSWPILTMVLAGAHFVLPFLLLLPRPAKRNVVWLAMISSILLVVHFIDMTWIIRPMADLGKSGVGTGPNYGTMWLDLAGPIGVGCLFVGFLIRKIYSGPLVAVNDARIDEAMHHKNYV